MAAKTAKQGTQAQNLIKALSFPMRAEILRILSERTASPVEISKELDENVSTVSHHVKVLVELGCARGVGERPRRGAVEHFYAATSKPWIDTADWDAMPAAIRKSFLGEIIELWLHDSVAAIDAGTVGDDSNFVLARDRLEVDEEGLTEAREITDRALKEIIEVEARSTKRRAKSEEESVTIAIMQGCIRLPAP